MLPGGHAPRPSAEADILDTFEGGPSGGGEPPGEGAGAFDLPPGGVPGQSLADGLRAWARGDAGRGRTAEPGADAGPGGQHGPGVFHRAPQKSTSSNVWRLCVLAFRLARALVRGGGLLWVEKAVRLLLYAAVLLPGFLQVSLFYLTSPRIVRGIRYGARSRNTLDVYLPPSSQGKQPQGVLDGRGAPVVIFLTGGAWIIGYKAWGALLGRDMAERGVVVVSPDYRNFPEAHMAGQLSDVDHAIAWTIRNCARLGGDPGNVTVVGQSCGAHLGILSLFRQVVTMGTSGVDERELLVAVESPPKSNDVSRRNNMGVINRENEDFTEDGGIDRVEWQKEAHTQALPSHTGPSLSPSPPTPREDPRWWHSTHSDGTAAPGSWDPGSIRHFVGVSGPYNLRLQERILHGRGLKAPVLDAIIRGADVQAKRSRGHEKSWEHKVSLATHSPVHVARSKRVASALREAEVERKLPSITLLHGGADATVPCASSVELAAALREDCALDAVRCVVFPRITHTGPLIECPMLGDDPVLDEILRLVLSGGGRTPPPTTGGMAQEAKRRMVPALLVRIAAGISPF